MLDTRRAIEADPREPGAEADAGGVTTVRRGRPWLTARRADLLTVAVPALLAAIVTLIALPTRSLWLDEGASISIASQGLGGLWAGIKHDGGNMAAYYTLLHGMIVLFGHGLWVLRLPSVIANVITAALVSRLSLRLLDGRRHRSIAICAGILTAVSLPLVFWGQDVRGYALMVTAATASWYALAVILQTPRGEHVPRRAVVAYVITTLVACYIGFDVVLLIPAQLLLLVLFRHRIKIVVAALVAVAVLCIPLFVIAASRGSGQLFWVPPLTWHAIRQAAVTLTSAGMPPNFRYRPMTNVTTILTVIPAAAAVVTAVRLTRRHGAFGAGESRGPWTLLLISSWLVVPIVIALAASVIGEPIELARISILMMPALALLLAWLLHRPELPRFAVPVGMGVLLTLRLLALVPSYGHSPEDWKSAVRHVLNADATGNKPACIIFYPQDARMPFGYYARDDMSQPPRRRELAGLTPILPTLAWGQIKPFVEIYKAPSAADRAQIANRCPRLWVIASHEGQEHGPNSSHADYERYHRLIDGFQDLYTTVDRNTYGYAAAVRVTFFKGRLPQRG